MRFVVLALALSGCSLLAWDDLTEGSGGIAAGGDTSSTSTATASSSASTGAPCVGDAEASAFSLTLADGVHCYRRVHAGSQWGLADLLCAEKFGGHLLVIDDVEEFGVHDALYPDDCAEPSYSCSDDPMVPRISRCDMRGWIGGRFVDDAPTWIDGTPWTWTATQFADGEPNTRTEPIALRTERSLDERPDNCPHAYLCEIEP